MNIDTRSIPLSQGKFATVSAEDHEWLSKDKWSAVKQQRKIGDRWYAKRHNKKGQHPRGKTIAMHLEIASRMGLVFSDNEECDHHDGDGLNCTRENLRVATLGQNSANAGKRKGATSEYKWVRKAPKCNSWIAQATVDGITHYLGSFKSEIEAAAVGAAFAIYFWGDFARFD